MKVKVKQVSIKHIAQNMGLYLAYFAHDMRRHTRHFHIRILLSLTLTSIGLLKGIQLSRALLTQAVFNLTQPRHMEQITMKFKVLAIIGLG